MGPRSLVILVLLEVLFTSTAATDIAGNAYTSRWDSTAFQHVPSTRTEHHAPTYTAPIPPSPPAPSSYKHTEAYTHEYTREHTWEESKTYGPPHTYTKTYQPHPTPTVASLDDALINAGCSKFLAFIKSDGDTWALYNSARVRTVFAPDDASFDHNTTTLARLRRRELTPEQQQQADLSAESQLTDLSKLRIVPGTVVPTNDNSANLLGSPQVVVSQVNTTTGDVKVVSGLGNQVSLKSTNIEYTNGLIHTTSGLLTNPLILTLTLLAHPSLSIFAALLAGRGKLATRQAQKLDFTPRVTVFIPSNEAFRAVGPITPSQASALLDGHTVVSDSVAKPVGYLPELQNGQVLRTEGGSSLVVSVRNGETYVGAGKIVQSNLILPNGVAHVVDKVLAPPIQTGAAVPGTVPAAGRAALVAAGVVAMALPSW